MSDEAILVPDGLTTYGLLGRRYLARMVDSMVIGALAFTALRILSATVPRLETLLLRILLNLLVFAFLWIGYGTPLESSRWQATLGKRLMGLRVYDSHGGRLRVS